MPFRYFVQAEAAAHAADLAHIALGEKAHLNFAMKEYKKGKPLKKVGP